MTARRTSLLPRRPKYLDEFADIVGDPYMAEVYFLGLDKKGLTIVKEKTPRPYRDVPPRPVLDGIIHGDNGYTLGCRCPVCSAGSSARHRAWRMRHDLPVYPPSPFGMQATHYPDLVDVVKDEKRAQEYFAEIRNRGLAIYKKTY